MIYYLTQGKNLNMPQVPLTHPCFDLVTLVRCVWLLAEPELCRAIDVYSVGTTTLSTHPAPTKPEVVLEGILSAYITEHTWWKNIWPNAHYVIVNASACWKDLLLFSLNFLLGNLCLAPTSSSTQPQYTNMMHFSVPSHSCLPVTRTLLTVQESGETLCNKTPRKNQLGRSEQTAITRKRSRSGAARRRWAATETS